MAKPAIPFPPGTFRASAKVVHEKKADSDDDEPKKYSHELFTEYDIKEDGTYAMHGYPPINEKGKIVVKEKVGQEFHVRVTNRVQTSQKGEWKPAEIDAVIRFAGDLKSFVWDAKTYYTPEARSAAEEKEEKKEDKEEKKDDGKGKRDEKKDKRSEKKDKKP